MVLFTITLGACEAGIFGESFECEEREALRVPYNLRVEEIAGEEYLVWDWDLDEAQFVILRSNTDDPEIFTSSGSTEETRYLLAELDAGYYYWVRAYVGGSSSGLDDPLYLE